MAIKEISGHVFSIPTEMEPVMGCTISKEVQENITYFSMAAGTDISAESYRKNKLWLVNSGSLEIIGGVENAGPGKGVVVNTGEIYVTPKENPVGAKTDSGAVYTEIILQEDLNMNQVLQAGEVFALKDMLPYREGQIVNMDLVNNEKMKFVLMSFDVGTGLSEHAAPGEALIFALDGEAVISYEGEDHVIKAGENFKFDKMGRHAVKAEKKFKMALLLELGE